jgi:hypothetical protein
MQNGIKSDARKGLVVLLAMHFGSEQAMRHGYSFPIRFWWLNICADLALAFNVETFLPRPG